MVCDHLQWLNKAGYVKLTDVKFYDEWHSKGWFLGLLAGFLTAAYKMKKAMDENKSLRSDLNKYGSDSARLIETTQKLSVVESTKQKQVMAMVKNGVDLIIPSARLGWLPVSDGTVGLAGTITSVIGIYDTWPAAKKPAAASKPIASTVAASK